MQENENGDEIWKDIPNCEGLYQASNLGNIFSKISNKLLKQRLGKHGYYTISLKKTTRTVHQLIAETFLDHVPNKYELVINHIDGIKTNNNVNNLEIVTNRYNSSFGERKTKVTSEHPGVCWITKSKKWQVDIQFENKGYYLGMFLLEEEAAKIYIKAVECVKNNTFIDFFNNEIKPTIKVHTKTSQYKGVRFDKNAKRWIAYCQINKVKYYFGQYLTELEAYNAYLEGIKDI